MSTETDLATAESAGEVVILSVHPASMDLRNAEALPREFVERVGACKNLVLDLSKVKFVDSAGLGTLISTLRHVLAASGNMRLAGPTVRGQVLLEVTRLERVFSVFPNTEPALDSFAVVREQ